MYRLTLDVPYRFVVRPAFERAIHAIDLAPDTTQNLYHDTGAGVVILMPSSLDKRWQANTVPISQINKQAQDWREAYRGLRHGTTPANFMARVLPALRDRTLIELLLEIALIAADPNRLRWVAETTFALERDEAWAVHIQCADDEYTRDGDYFYAQWDRYALRMDTDGHLTFFRYADRTQLNLPPKPIASWFSGVASPVRNAITVAALPLPPLGVLVLTIVSGGANLVQMTASSTTRQLVSSKLIPLADDAENIGTEEAPVYSLCRPSPLRLAVNVMYNPIVAFERVRYATQGTLVEKPFDVPPINPQVPQGTPIVAYTHVQTASISFQRADGENWVDWNTDASPTMARAKLQLNTSNTLYTPIVVGYFMRCEPLVAARNTTPIEVPRVLELELTTDEMAREEGYVECLLESDTLRTIANRGDTTYRLEYSDDGGTSWHTLSEGFALTERIEWMRPRVSGIPYRARFALKGMWSRFSEVYQMSQTAFDGVSLAEAFNKLLDGCGFERIANPPAELEAIRMPTAPKGDTSSGWRYAPRVGQSGEEILRTLLLFATATGNEWRLRWDFETGKWLLERKPNGQPEWVLKSGGTVNPALREARYSELSMEPKPPEANLIYAEGATSPNKEGERLVVVLVNEDSLTEPRSLDYLGRIKMVRVQAEAMGEMADLERLANRLYEAAARHALNASITIPLAPRYPAALLELIRLPRAVRIYVDNTEVLSGYIKEATLNASGGESPKAQLKLIFSTRYASDPRH